MKYYRLIGSKRDWPSFEENKIYEETHNPSPCLNVAVTTHVRWSPEHWREVTEQEYLDQNFVLPEKWGVKVTKENIDVLHKWKQVKKFDARPIINNYVDNKGSSSLFLYSDETEITFEQFKKYVLKEETMDKKIIGYKLISPEYEKVALKALVLTSAHDPFIIAGMLSYYVPKLHDLGIMSWFEPVYKEEKTQEQIKDEIKTFLCEKYNIKKRDVCYCKWNEDKFKKLTIKSLTLVNRDESYTGNFSQLSHSYFTNNPTENWQLLIKGVDENNLLNTVSVDELITKEEYDKDVTPKINIENYDAKFNKDGVTFGCQTYSKEFVDTLYNLLKNNSFIIYDHYGHPLNGRIYRIYDYLNK